MLSLCSLVICASSVSGLYPCIVCFFSSPHSSNAVLSLQMSKKGAITSYSLETQKNCQASYHIIAQETQEKCKVFYHIVAQETLRKLQSILSHCSSRNSRKMQSVLSHCSSRDSRKLQWHMLRKWLWTCVQVCIQVMSKRYPVSASGYVIPCSFSISKFLCLVTKCI
jgi:hypothetical protein